ncbi:MAG TPA: TlpA family protein disulfide reductase [Herpetosiphonaceae bacterium]|nr:TlpA family protein disulfide reductase [Herpetosiphonaceae bacterium]
MPALTVAPTGTPEPTSTSAPTPELATTEGADALTAELPAIVVEALGADQPAATQTGGPGTPAPEFELRSLDGKQVRLRDFRGRPVMLSFFATTCAPCKKELPLLKQLQRQYADELAVLLVGVFEDPETVAPYAQELGIEDMPILLDGFAEATMEYGVMTIPSTIFIDREGRIAASEFGAVGRSRLEVGLTKIGLGTMPDVDSASDPGATGIPLEGCALGDC